MSPVHDREDPDRARAEEAKAIAKELRAECPVCKAPAGSWCMNSLGMEGLHAKRIDALLDLWDDSL